MSLLYKHTSCVSLALRRILNIAKMINDIQLQRHHTSDETNIIYSIYLLLFHHNISYLSLPTCFDSLTLHINANAVHVVPVIEHWLDLLKSRLFLYTSVL